MKKEANLLIDILKNISNKFKESNGVFKIDIIKNNTIDLQIVHPILLDQIRAINSKNFGFVIVLSFSIDDYKLIDSFEKSMMYKDFSKLSDACSITYYSNCITDINYVEYQATLVLEEVFNYDNNTDAVINVTEVPQLPQV